MTTGMIRRMNMKTMTCEIAAQLMEKERMKILKYKVYSERNTSKDLETLEEALKEYEEIKDWEISNECDMDTYVEIIASEDEYFEEHTAIRRANIVVDEERMAISTPKEEGWDFEFWAKWEEQIN